MCSECVFTVLPASSTLVVSHANAGRFHIGLVASGAVLLTIVNHFTTTALAVLILTV